jgi:electron transfer flavoprotein beta subunit
VAASQAAIETADADAVTGRRVRVRVLRTAPYRPRPRTLPPPSGGSPRDRLLALTGALSERTPPRVVRATPEEAADELIRYLKNQGYLS